MLAGYWTVNGSRLPKLTFCYQIKKAKMSINLDSRFVHPKITSSNQDGKCWH